MNTIRKPGRSRNVILALALVAAYPVDARAQTKVAISAKRTPPTHTISIVHRVTLTDAASPVEGGMYLGTRIDSRHRYYLIPAIDQRILVFDSAGRFLQSFGRKGNGPGEFQHVWNVFFGPDDTLYVGENTGRISKFTPDYQFVDRYEKGVEVSSFATRLQDGRIAQIVSIFEERVHAHRGANPEARRRGTRVGSNSSPYALELIDIREKGTKRFDVGPPANAEGTFNRNNFHVAAGLGGTVWLGFRDSYKLEQWDTTGRLVRALMRTLDGLPFDGVPSRYLSKVVTGSFASDQDGRLWIVSGVPTGRTVKRRVRSVRGIEEINVPEHDMVVEVIDPVKNRLVASKRFPAAERHCEFIKAGLLVCQSTQDVEIPTWELSDIKLNASR
jgi:hypothetical protein